MEWIKGKSLRYIRKILKRGGWETRWNNEANELECCRFNSGVPLDNFTVTFTEKLRAREVIWTRANGYLIYDY